MVTRAQDQGGTPPTLALRAACNRHHEPLRLLQLSQCCTCGELPPQSALLKFAAHESVPLCYGEPLVFFLPNPRWYGECLYRQPSRPPRCVCPLHHGPQVSTSI